MRRRPLPNLALEIAAHPGLVHQVASAVGQSAGGHSSRLLEQPEPGRLIVEYTTSVLGRSLQTVEEVTLTPPNRIHYRLLRGPLPAVEEEFEIAGRPGGCTLSYSGWFEPHPGPIRGLLDRWLTPPLYRRALLSSMARVKAISEARQVSSRQFRVDR